MKLVDNILLFRLRNMEIKVNIRMLFLSIVILVVGILYILLGIRFDLEKNFLLYEIGNNDYRLVISHDDFDLLKSSNQFKYEGENYYYLVKTIDDEPIIQNGIIYLSVVIEAPKFSTISNQIVEIGVSHESKSIFSYLKSYFRKE